MMKDADEDENIVATNIRAIQLLDSTNCNATLS